MPKQEPILFVGAGPGDPELITVKGQKGLMAADVIVYAGSLVPEAVLAWARPEAKMIDSAPLTLARIIADMEKAYRQGKKVVRLHSGDPSLYGAIFEQMLALEEKSIPYKILPGVTAAFAAAASLGIEYTVPEVCQTLIITRAAGRTPAPEREALEKLAAHRASLAVYLSMSLVEKVARALMPAYGPRAPCAVVYRASQPDEKILATRLENLVDKVKAHKITRQAVVIVGKALEVRQTGLRRPSRLYAENFSHGCRAAGKSPPAK